MFLSILFFVFCLLPHACQAHEINSVSAKLYLRTGKLLNGSTKKTNATITKGNFMIVYIDVAQMAEAFREQVIHDYEFVKNPFMDKTINPSHRAHLFQMYLEKFAKYTQLKLGNQINPKNAVEIVFFAIRPLNSRRGTCKTLIFLKSPCGGFRGRKLKLE